MTKKSRLDELIVSHGLAETVQMAERLIRAGQVLVDDTCIDKPGTQVQLDANVRMKGGKSFVSRAGHKLAGALADFGLDVSGKRCLDVGIARGTNSSTSIEFNRSADRRDPKTNYRLFDEPQALVAEAAR